MKKTPEEILENHGHWHEFDKNKIIIAMQEYATQCQQDNAETIRTFLIEACDLMDFCIDRGYLDNEDLTDGQKSFEAAKQKLLATLNKQ